MKKIKIIVSALFVLLMFVGCDIIVKKIEVTDCIVGTWYSDKTNETFIFNSNGSLTVTDGYVSFYFTYERVNKEEIEILINLQSFCTFMFTCDDEFVIGEPLNNSFHRLK
ncbi:MAG: hypothetical protein LBH98_03455 [Chitinispirillales bacterium]|jgi:hypothetical protein|nr:hypothetical protein [Chitinispirillales bacterium]